MSYCSDCFKAVRHEGRPEGKIETIGDVECYVATPVEPPEENLRDSVILFLTDAYGHVFLNNQLLADNYARNGFSVIMPDLFGGEPVPSFVPPDASISKERFDVVAWIDRHPPETVQPAMEKLITALQQRGVRELVGLGYCFGARVALDLAFVNAINVCIVSHPSFWRVPADLERYLNVSNAPLLINSCEVDEMFPKHAQDKADEILGKGVFRPGYERTYWEGCAHGFATRGDMTRQCVRAGKEGAFKASVEFLRKHL